MKISFEKVERAMAYAGINQFDVAERLGIAKSGVCRLLARVKDGKDITPKNVSRLAQALEVDIDSLIEAAAP